MHFTGFELVDRNINELFWLTWRRVALAMQVHHVYTQTSKLEILRWLCAHQCYAVFPSYWPIGRDCMRKQCPNSRGNLITSDGIVKLYCISLPSISSEYTTLSKRSLLIGSCGRIDSCTRDIHACDRASIKLEDSGRIPLFSGTFWLNFWGFWQTEHDVNLRGATTISCMLDRKKKYNYLRARLLRSSPAYDAIVRIRDNIHPGTKLSTLAYAWP